MQFYGNLESWNCFVVVTLDVIKHFRWNQFGRKEEHYIATRFSVNPVYLMRRTDPFKGKSIMFLIFKYCI